MNYNYQKARELMVENQLRPNKIKNPVILDLFKEIPKENFILNGEKTIPYSDSDVPLIDNRGYLKNLHIAQLINYAEIKKEHKILHLGALTGYVTVLISNLCMKVYAVETNEILKSQLKNNVKKSNSNNIEVVEGSFIDGFKSHEPYDRIIIDSPIKNIRNNIFDQLSSNLGKVVMIKRENIYLSKAIKITKNNKNFSKEYLFDIFSKYDLIEENKGFEF